MTQAPDIRVVSAECARRIDALGAWLGLDPWKAERTPDGLVYKPLNPTRGDRNPGSFIVYGAGHKKAGGWVDYVDPDRLKGDALDLAGYIKTGDPRDRREAYKWGLRFLGWEGVGGLDRTEDMAARAQLEIDRKEAEARAAAERERERRTVFNVWSHDRRLEPGNVAWRYLSETRGIDLALLAAEKRLPNAVRYRMEAFDPIGERRWAAMTSLITSHDDRPLAVHRTFLDRETHQKADISAPRRISPAGFWGGAIRLAKGASRLSPAKALEAGCRDVLAIAEGVEDALSVAVAVREWRVWAAGTLGAMGAVIWPENTRAVVLIKDRTDLKATERARQEAEGHWQAALRKAALQAQEKSIALYWVEPKGDAKDFNDALRAKAAQLNREAV